MVIGPPAAIWRSNTGTTLPRLPRTLPKRTAQKCVVEALRLITIRSPMRLLAPSTPVASTALSLLMKTNSPVLHRSAARTQFQVPPTLVCAAGAGWVSRISTCL